MKYRYFVFYQLHDKDGVGGHGRLELLRNWPIAGWTDILSIERDIVKNDPLAHSAMVQSWQRFETDD